MMQVVVAYPSKHGSTEGIAQAIANRLRGWGWDATARSVEDVTDLGGVEGWYWGAPYTRGEVEDEEEQPRQLAELTAMLRPKDQERRTLEFGRGRRSAPCSRR